MGKSYKAFPPYTNSGGDGGNRTHVRKHNSEDPYVRSLSFYFTSSVRQTGVLSVEPENEFIGLPQA